MSGQYRTKLQDRQTFEEKEMKKHPGFKAVQKKIQSEGYSKKSAGAILANASRHASPAAKRKNPNLAKVLSKHK